MNQTAQKEHSKSQQILVKTHLTHKVINTQVKAVPHNPNLLSHKWLSI